MRPSAIRLLILTIFATTVVPVVTAVDVAASSRHIRKHHQQTNLGWNNSLRRSWASDELRPVAPSWSGGGDVCPGSARSFDCRIWPPPFDDDSDRKSGDGGGG